MNSPLDSMIQRDPDSSHYFKSKRKIPWISKSDDLVKSLKRRISVIPAKAGIQLFQILKNSLDSGFHRSDDFLRDHQE
jgi:hypothetical protein